MRATRLLLFLLFSLVAQTLFIRKGFAQPSLWHVADLSGKTRFSVWGDSLFSLGDGHYVLMENGSSLVFKDDPFHPLFRTSDQISPISPGWISIYNGMTYRLAHTKRITAPLSPHFKEIKIWNQSILACVESRWIWQPGSPFELTADSVLLQPKTLVLYQPDGLVLIDSTLLPRSFPIRGEQRMLSPGNMFVLTDSIWQPLHADHRAFIHKPNALWWNDTSLVDTLGKQVFLQTCAAPRKKIGDTVFVVSPSFLAVRANGKWRMRTAAGKWTKLAERFTCQPVNDTLVAVRSARNHVIIGISGSKTTLNRSITQVKGLSEGLIMAKDDGRFGFVDQHGYIRIACRYDSLLPFMNGLAPARIHNRWGLLNRDEKIIVQPHYQKIEPPRHNIYAVENEGKWGLLRTNGEVALSTQFDTLEPGKYKGWVLSKGVWKGWANENGQMIIQPKYFSTIELPFGLIKLVRNQGQGLADSSGTPVLPINWNAIYINPHHQEIIYR